LIREGVELFEKKQALQPLREAIGTHVVIPAFYREEKTAVAFDINKLAEEYEIGTRKGGQFLKNLFFKRGESPRDILILIELAHQKNLLRKMVNNSTLLRHPEYLEKKGLFIKSMGACHGDMKITFNLISANSYEHYSSLESESFLDQIGIIEVGQIGEGKDNVVSLVWTDFKKFMALRKHKVNRSALFSASCKKSALKLTNLQGN
jgi:hypothetical protein